MAIVVDGHVHFYPEFSVPEFFAAAWRNFEKVQDTHGLGEDADYVIFLTEGGKHDMFSKLCDMADAGADDVHSTGALKRTKEPNSLVVEEDGRRLYVFGGRQYVSSENIELLSLFSREAIPDKSMPLGELAQKVAAVGGIVVIPWGVGKWFGKRGEVVKTLFEQKIDFPLFCGDSGNRPLFWPTPALLSFATEKGVPLLSGSDPLPLASHCERVASSGAILLDGKISVSHPGASLREQLVTGKRRAAFGTRMNPLRFFYDQFHMNVMSRF